MTTEIDLMHAPPSEAELARFVELQARLPDLWRAVHTSTDVPHTSVVIPSISFDPDEIKKIDGVACYEERLLFSLIRVVGGFSIGVLIAALFGLEGVERGVLILQSSMPVAVFNYLLALRYQREPGEVAGMVVISTLLAFVLLPFIVSFVLA